MNLYPMPSLNVNIDVADLMSKFEGDKQAFESNIRKSVQALAASTHAHIMDQAADKLHSRYRMFADAMKNSFRQLDDQTWVIEIPSSVMWIEDGQEPHDMTEMLNHSSKAKTAKDGSKYMTIPFQHNKGGTYQTQSARSITDMLKRELKERKIPYGKIEKTASGKPKTGLLHSVDLGGPKKPHWSSPVLDGVRIYQKVVGQRGGQPVVQRSVMTFRTISSKHSGVKWQHPGNKPMHFIEEAYDWAMREWSDTMLPGIMEKFTVK